MEAILKVKSSEFTDELVGKIKHILTNMKDAELTISISEYKDMGNLRDESKKEYFNRLDKGIKNFENGNVITFDGDSFESFSKHLLNEE